MHEYLGVIRFHVLKDRPDLYHWRPTDASVVDELDGVRMRLWVETGTHEYHEQWVADPTAE